MNLDSGHRLAGEKPDHVIGGVHGEHKQRVKDLFVAPVQDVIPKESRAIITVDKKDSISATFKLLIDKHILSVPVYDSHAHGYVGFIDMVDMVNHSLAVLTESDLMGGEFPKHVEAKGRFSAEPISTLDLSHRNPWKPVEPRMPFSIVLDYMVSWQAHRIPVVDGEGEFTSLITQSTVLNILHSHSDSLPADALSATLGSLGLSFAPVTSVKLTDKAITAFKLMKSQHYSAVAVVDDQGHLVGNISASDLKTIGYDAKMFSQLFLSVAEFVKLLPATTFGGPIVVSSKSTVEEAMTKLVKGKVHRLYVVEQGAEKPTGVVTQLDVIKAIRAHHKAHAHHHEHLAKSAPGSKPEVAHEKKLKGSAH